MLLIQSLPSKATLEFTDNCKKAYAEIFQLRFNTASALIAEEEKNNPSNKTTAYLKHYLLFYKAFLSEETADFIALKKSRASTLLLLDTEKSTSPYFRLFKAEIEITTSFIKIKNKEYATGAIELRRGYKLLEENKNLFPGFKPNLKSLGIIHAFIGAVPENFTWLLKIAGMYGTIKQGINELAEFYYSTSINNSQFSFMNTESHFIYIFTKQYLQKNEKELALLYENVNATDGALQMFAKMSYHYYRFNGEKVLQILKDRRNLNNEYPLHYLDYMEGLTRLNKLDTTGSNYFNKYIQNFKGTGFIKAAYQKLAWIELIKGNRKNYETLITKALHNGNDFTDEDKQALNEAKNKIVPNVSLLKARLLFDGGYFSEALKQLSAKSHGEYETLKEKLELTYRMARIYDKLGNSDKAVSFYEATIKNGENTTYYFAANSALHAAFLYENLNDTVKAISYYRRVLKMRNHDYQNSIDQKAKAGLNRLGKS